jgi:patatin-like phospholipase/acyl hydrolase
LADGGGIRGYSSLLILQQLMIEVAKWETRLEAEEIADESQRGTFEASKLLPCHYFDFMYGTSTGGLIATMLGRLRMTVGQCLKEYRIVGNELFGHKRSKIPLATKYNHTPLEKEVRRIVKENCPVHNGSCDGMDWHPWDVDVVLEEENSMEPVIQSMERICQRYDYLHLCVCKV